MNEDTQNPTPEVQEAEVVPDTPDKVGEKIEEENPQVENIPPTVEEPETPPSEKPEEASSEDSEIYIVRSDETGDKVYAIRKEKRYWVKNPETLKKMGFYLGREKKIPFSELLNFPEGEPIDVTVLDAIYPWDKPEEEQTTASDNPYRVWS